MDELNDSLRVRLMKQKNKAHVTTPLIPSKFRGAQQSSCLSWAPTDLSPIQYQSPISDASVADGVTVVSGPSLKAAAPPSKRSSEHWQEVIAALPDRDKEEKKDGNGNNNQKQLNIKKKPSKRSLLSDITDLGKKHDEENSLEQTKKRKVAEEKTSFQFKSKANKIKLKPPPNQKSILSFFKAK